MSSSTSYHGVGSCKDNIRPNSLLILPLYDCMKYIFLKRVLFLAHLSRRLKVSYCNRSVGCAQKFSLNDIS